MSWLIAGTAFLVLAGVAVTGTVYVFREFGKAMNSITAA